MVTIIALLGIGLVGSLMLGSSTDEGELESDSSEIEELTIIHETEGELEPPHTESDHIDAQDGEFPAREDGFEFDDSFLASRNLIHGGPESDFLDGTEGTLNDIGDHIFGGDGNDVLVGGNGDVMIGGAGVDRFEVSDQDSVHILGFQDDEMLVVTYAGNPPNITGDATDDGTSILSNGVPIAHLEGVYNFDFERVALVRSA